ncbi:hypothetical protein K504DRAFT_503842 [Pleomassaria siparia CBS 279.74]|uniref:F-box domain-containing protein n=1 Tax=Pleomassaria siparia CBS 279.74 TaxID=1314801 RepID=A0A6G1K4S1_9PLEO|nr:hypothetical protein K504DRAFT_503842 [Pleomassaria siparia CBS 279.74]
MPQPQPPKRKMEDTSGVLVSSKRVNSLAGLGGPVPSPPLEYEKAIDTDQGSETLEVPVTQCDLLETLPEELVAKIFDHLRGDSGSLFNVSLASQRCQRIGVNALYASVGSAGRCFVRTIVENSNSGLAQKVHSVEWCVKAVKQYPQAHLTARERTEFGNHVSQLQLPNAVEVDNWMNRLTLALDESAQLSIVLLLATNIRELTILSDATLSIGSGRDFDWVNMLIDAACGSPRGLENSFQHLNRFHFEMPLSFIQMPYLACILRLPSLRTFILEGATHPFPISPAEWRCAAASSGVEHIRLDRSFLDSNVVAMLLASCKAVKTFTYEYDSITWEPFSPPPANRWAQHSWSMIGDALRRHEDSLETLTLVDNTDAALMTIVARHFPAFQTGLDYGHLGSLHRFQKLRDVQVPLAAFTSKMSWAPDATEYNAQDFPYSLPSGIEYLDISVDQKEYPGFRPLCGESNALKTLKDAVVANNFPELQRIDVFVEKSAVISRIPLLDPIEVLENKGVDVYFFLGDDYVCLQDLEQDEVAATD